MKKYLLFHRVNPRRHWSVISLLCFLIVICISPFFLFTSSQTAQAVQEIETTAEEDDYYDAAPQRPANGMYERARIGTFMAPTDVRIGNASIVLIHGFHGKRSSVGNGSKHGVDCKQAWGTVMDYIQSSHTIAGNSLRWGNVEIQTVGYYANDKNCSVNLHDQRYTERCKNYVAGNEGTNNESLYRLSCLFAWYLYLNFASQNKPVEIIAHSMGGLITRNTLYQVEKSKAPYVFPPTLGTITDVIDFVTPHKGIPKLLGSVPSFFMCGNCRQLQEMTEGSTFLTEMNNFAQNPQASSGTDWTLIGSDCDLYVSEKNATYMAADHHVIFMNNNKNGSCYGHENILHDSNDKQNAYYYHCERCLQAPPSSGYNFKSWKYWSSAPRALHEMMHALWLYW